MKINNNFNINSLVDNRDVAIVRGRKTDALFKVFQVAPNIWIAPERYYGESLNINEDQNLMEEFMILVSFQQIMKKMNFYKQLLRYYKE